MNLSTKSISEAAFVTRFNAELAARGEPERLTADRSTMLGDFRLEAGGGPRAWLRDFEVESIARRHGILADGETVRFKHAPKEGRRYGSDAR